MIGYGNDDPPFTSENKDKEIFHPPRPDALGPQDLRRFKQMAGYE
jgi:hypothetical protein